MTYVLLSWLVPTVHVLACFFLIVVVLLQTGKGADMGAVFGGGSQTLFGSGGAGNLLTKLTTGTAAAFMVTSLILTVGQSREPSSRLLERFPAPAAQEAPVPPAPSERDVTPDANAPTENPPQANAGGPTEPPPAAGTGAAAKDALPPTEAPKAADAPKGTDAAPATP